MTSCQISNKQEIRQGDAARPPLTGWAVLGLLSFRGERTGYELKKWADSSLRFFYWSPAISQIYAELRRLEALGYATSRRSGAEEPRATRRYTITEAGRRALTAWADESDDPGAPVLKHPLVLRVWLGHLAAPDTLRALVEQHIERTRGELKEVRDARLRAERVAEWEFPVIALGWSERQHLAELELAEAMLADLDRLAAARRGTRDDSPPDGAVRR
ncbi:PadR family transcriptional regulator [Streptomyces sp. NPDC053427]|uniref:PadR family transcriptional regulator n=1 Tax=Streptomyces sp. NPDC053427 TaxID=3365701 RepID=UPI0037D2510C